MDAVSIRFFLLRNTSIACFSFISKFIFIKIVQSDIPSILCHKYIFGKFLFFFAMVNVLLSFVTRYVVLLSIAYYNFLLD
jgi:hypothetical protein